MTGGLLGLLHPIFGLKPPSTKTLYLFSSGLTSRLTLVRPVFLGHSHVFQPCSSFNSTSEHQTA
jgi:hypothetical protein